MDKISIVITTYNHEKYIAQAIESALAQKDCPEFEIIIGNDCSTDKTGLIIEEYKEKYSHTIKVLPRSKNLGMLHNLKDCFNNCSGNYIAILEGDDYWINEHKLKKQYEALKNDKNALVAYNDIILEYIDAKENIERKNHLVGFKKDLNNTTIKDLIIGRNPIGNFSCCMYKKDALKLIPNSYYERGGGADFLFHLYILDKTPYAIFIKENLSVYRIHSDGTYSSLSEDEKTINTHHALYEYNKIFKDKYKKEFYNWAKNPPRYKRIFGFSTSIFKTKRIFIGIAQKPIKNVRKF